MSQSTTNVDKTTSNKNCQMVPSKSEGLILKTAEKISKTSAISQLLIGSVSGWTTGFLTMKIGRKAAFAAGGSVILFQIAHHKGFIKTDWHQLKQKVEQSTQKIDCKCGQKAPIWISNVKKFSKSNTCFAAGFIGGFLIGLAC